MAALASRAWVARLPRFRPEVLLVAVTVVAFLVAWWPVLAGRQVLIGADNLHQYLPWQAESATSASANALVRDPPTQFLPWQTLVRDQFTSGCLPLWNDGALSGQPLLANDQSAPFSPFTWLAMPFSPAIGLSLAMLAKLWVAGLGMAMLLRLLGCRGVAMVAGGIAYATSSFMVVWLAWPHTAVAAILPWAVAAAEWYLQRGTRLAICALAAAIGLQFVGGHAETSLHLGVGLAVYCGVRWALDSRDWRRLIGLVEGTVVGVLLGAVQVLPFLSALQVSTLAADRAASHAGAAHLAPTELLSWLVPNASGNPGTDGRLGPPPNYNEATGFAGVAMLALAPLGTVSLWLRKRSQVVALLAVALVAGGVVYGPLSSLAGRLPLLSVSNNARMTVLLCLAVTALGAVGLQAVQERVSRGKRWRVAGELALTVGGGATALLVAGGLLLAVHLAGNRPWPGTSYHSLLFWAGMAALALVSAVGFVASALLAGNGRLAAAGLGFLVLVEGCLFAVPYEPRSAADGAVPTSSVTTWLTQHAGGAQIAATDTALVPNTPSLYGLHDVRSYDVVRDWRSRAFWSAADPRYRDDFLVTVLGQPRPSWLALAGVQYLVTAGGALPGTTPVFSADGLTVSTVPGAMPFAWASPTWSTAPGPAAARARLVADLKAAPVIEGLRASSNVAAGPAAVSVLTRQPGEVDLRAVASSEQAVVIQQSFADGWTATIDGRPATVHPADVQFQAVLVPAGDHRVSLRYLPRSVVEGAWLSGLGLALLGLSFGLAWAGRRRGRGEPKGRDDG